MPHFFFFYVIYYFLLLVIFACNCNFCLLFNPNKWYQSEVVFFFSYPLQESLTVEWEPHNQVGSMADEGKLRIDKLNGKKI